MNKKTDEEGALEAMRDASAELVKYLDAINAKMNALNHQNECKSIYMSVA